MRAFFARRRRLSGKLRSHTCAATRQQPRRPLMPAALVSRWCTLLVALLCIVSSVPLTAQETVTYTYDALGRLVQVNHGTTGPNANVSATYNYDHADNRTQVVVNAGASALTLSPATLPGGTVGSAYSQTLAASGGTGGYSFALSAGTLPAGLSLTSAGVLSGTPTTATTYSFTIKATDSAGSGGSRAYNVTISPSNTLTLSPASLGGGTVGSVYNQTITATGGTVPYTFAVTAGSVPAGLTLSSGGVLSGTPTTATTFSFTVKATDSTGSHIGSKAYSVTISPSTGVTLSPATFASGTVGAPYSQTITAAGGTSPYTFAITSGSLPAGLTLSSGGVLSGTPTTAAVSNFTIQATDTGANHIGTQSYSLTISPANDLVLSPATVANGTVGAAYSQTITATGGSGSYTFAISGGSLPAGLTLSSAGVISGTPTTATSYSFTVKATDSAGNHIGSKAYSVTIGQANDLALSPASLAGGTVGAAYSQTITAAGGSGSYTFALTAGSVPAGLTLSSAGVLSGTPTTATSYSFTVKATDSGGNHIGSQSYTVGIGQANDLVLSPATLASGTVGAAYSQTIAATGGSGSFTFAVTSGGLPAGLTLSSAGVLSGTPSTATTYSFTVKATDSAGNHIGSQSYSVTISPANDLALSPTALPSGKVSTAYSQTMTASGGNGSYSFAVTAGSVPTGLTLSAAGVLSGTPTTATTYSFTIEAIDSAGNHIGSQAYSLVIGAANPPITANFDNGGSISCGGITVQINVVANDTGGVPPLSLVSASGATVVSSTDVTVTSGARAGTKAFTYVVQDSVGTQATGSGSVTVTSPCQ